MELKENLDIMIRLYEHKLRKNSNSYQAQYLLEKVSFLQCLREVLWVSESKENKNKFIEEMMRE